MSIYSRKSHGFYPEKSYVVTTVHTYLLPHLTYTDLVWCTWNGFRTLLHGSFFVATGKHPPLPCGRNSDGGPTLTSRRKLSETLAVFICVSGSSPLHLLALLKPTSPVYTAITPGLCLQIAFPSFNRVSSLDAHHLAFEGFQDGTPLPYVPSLRQRLRGRGSIGKGCA